MTQVQFAVAWTRTAPGNLDFILELYLPVPQPVKSYLESFILAVGSVIMDSVEKQLRNDRPAAPQYSNITSTPLITRERQENSDITHMAWNHGVIHRF